MHSSFYSTNNQFCLFLQGIANKFRSFCYIAILWDELLEIVNKAILFNNVTRYSLIMYADSDKYSAKYKNQLFNGTHLLSIVYSALIEIIVLVCGLTLIGIFIVKTVIRLFCKRLLLQ